MALSSLLFTRLTKSEMREIEIWGRLRGALSAGRGVSPRCAKMYLELERFQKFSNSHQLICEISKKVIKAILLLLSIAPYQP